MTTPRQAKLSWDRVHGSQRSAFTLIEILVVISILVVLAAMAALFWPGFELQQRSSAGASHLQEWLFIAKNRALLERSPRGLRLYPDPNNPNFFNSAQLIEVPEDFTGGNVYMDSDPATGNPIPDRLILTGVDITGGEADPELFPVQAGDMKLGTGDYIQVQGSGVMHQFVVARDKNGNLMIDTKNNVATLQLYSPLAEAIPLMTYDNNGNPQPPAQGGSYRIVRTARPLGEDPLELPYNVGVDLTTNVTYGQQLPLNQDGTLDIMFSPSGTLLGNYGTDKMIFWVREYSDQDSPFYGQPGLIVVFTRSGAISAYDVNQLARTNPSISPYSKVR